MLSQKIEDDGGQECFGLHRNAMQCNAMVIFA
jgi:hypothetical protein